MAERDVLEIDGVEIWACERCKGYKALATGTTCQRCDGKGHIYHLIPGTLSAAIQRLGWAAWDAGPFFGKVNGVRLEFNTAIAAVQELMDRPTPPEGTNGK